jgi:hypothetical protein
LKGAPVIVPNDGFIQVFDNWGVSAGSGYNQHWLYINGIDCDFGLNVVPSIQTPASYVYKSGFFPVKRGDEIVFSMSFAGNSTITRNPARPYLKFYPALPVNYVRNSGTPIPDSATRSVLAAEVNGHAFFPLKADGTFGAPYTMTEGGFVFLDVGAMFPTTTTNISNHMTLYINGYLYSEVVFIENGSDGGSTTQRQMWASLYAVPVAAGDKLELKISCGYDNSYVMQYAAHGSELNWMRARIA